MFTIKHSVLAVVVALAAVACGGASEDPTPPAWSCSGGTLTVRGPVDHIEARFDLAPGALLAHTASPAVFIVDAPGGWLTFDLYEAVPAGASATITTHDANSGLGVCPVEVR